MDAIFNEIEQEAIAYFKKEEEEKEEKARVEASSHRITLRRRYFALKMKVSDMNRMKLKDEAKAARRALKLFRMENKHNDYC